MATMEKMGFGEKYPSPRGDEMQLKCYKKFVIAARYPSPRGDEMQQDLIVKNIKGAVCIRPRVGMRCNQNFGRNTVKRREYPSPRGDEMQREPRADTRFFRRLYPSPRGDEMQLDLLGDNRNWDVYPSPRGDEMQRYGSRMLADTAKRVSVPAWG